MLRHFRRPHLKKAKSRGQSLVEITLFLPLLIMMLSGLIEFGFALNQYINMVEAAREGARYGSDSDPADRDLITTPDPLTGEIHSNMDCTTTRDFYAKIACVVQRAATPIILDPAKDDVIVSVYRVYSDTLTGSTTLLAPWPDPADDPAWGDEPGQWRLTGSGGSSRFNTEKVASLIDTSAPGAGILVVEVWYLYHYLLNLPWLDVFLPDDGLRFYTYTIIPLPAAEPRPTPTATPTASNTPPITATPTSTPTPGNSPTPTNTPTPSDTPTPTDTPTATEIPTNTPTPTPTPACRTGVASASFSTLSVTQPITVSANGGLPASSGIVQIRLHLRDECNEALDGLSPALSSSRPSSDAIAGPVATGNGDYFFQVSSLIVSTAPSTFTAQVIDPVAGVVMITPNPSFDVYFVCVSGSWVPNPLPQNLQFRFINPSTPATNRRLIWLRLDWDPQSGDQLSAINFGSASNQVWTGSATADPIIIGSSDWTGSNRSIVTGTSKFIQLAFNFAVAGRSYTLTTQWDDGNNQDVCTSLPVTASP